MERAIIRLKASPVATLTSFAAKSMIPEYWSEIFLFAKHTPFWFIVDSLGL
jgi:hypothetical protein